MSSETASMVQPASGVERIRHPGIVPLELSDLWVEGATLWEWSYSPGFAGALRRALEHWRSGDSSNRWSEPAPAGLPGFEAVFVTGGRSKDLAVRAELSRLSCPVVFGEDPVFGGECGGFAILQARHLSGWVLDLGKSQFKLSAPGLRWIFPRDWKRFPPAGQVSARDIPAQRRRIREFIALKLRRALVETSQPAQAIVFGLHARLSDDGTPAGSSYAGVRGDRNLVRDAVDLAGLENLPVLVINDAELAAWSVFLDATLSPFGKVLVLTLGFGIGAAVVQRLPSAAGLRANDASDTSHKSRSGAWPVQGRRL